MSLDEHVPGEPKQLRYPGGKDGMWQVECSCGEYRSSPYAYPGHAERAAKAHADAKNSQASP